MSTMDLRTAKNRVEAVADCTSTQGWTCVGKITAIKLVRKVWEEAYAAGEYDGIAKGRETAPASDEWDRGYEQGRKDGGDQDQWQRGYDVGKADATHSFENNFEYRAQKYMEEQIGQYVRMRRLMSDIGADRAE